MIKNISLTRLTCNAPDDKTAHVEETSSAGRKQADLHVATRLIALYQRARGEEALVSVWPT